MLAAGSAHPKSRATSLRVRTKCAIHTVHTLLAAFCARSRFMGSMYLSPCDSDLNLSNVASFVCVARCACNV
eukprot:351259-Chlamydomonas_euryale.AAC.1